jgi:hypothetical protein
MIFRQINYIEPLRNNEDASLPTIADSHGDLLQEVALQRAQRGIASAFTTDKSGNVFIDNRVLWDNLNKIPKDGNLAIVATKDESKLLNRQLTEHPKLNSIVRNIIDEKPTELYVVVIPEGMQSALKYQAAHRVFTLNNGTKIGVVFVKSNKIEAGALENELAEVEMQIGSKSGIIRLPGSVDLTSDTISALYRKKLLGTLTPNVANQMIQYFNERPEYGQGGQFEVSERDKHYIKEKLEERLRRNGIDKIGDKRLVVTEDLKLKLK